MLVSHEIRPPVPADENRDVLLHDVADEVAKHSPVHHRLNRNLDVDEMRTVPEFVAMKSPVGNLARQHRSTGALTSFTVGARAEHRVAIDNGGALHPRAVLSWLRRVADHIGGARLENLHSAIGSELLAI